MDAATRAVVRARAADRCEYCQRSQARSPLIPLQVEHIVARKHGGSDDLDNLALACAECAACNVGNHIKGTATVRPSINLTDMESAANSTNFANAEFGTCARPLVFLVEVLIPRLQEQVLILGDRLLDCGQL